MKRHVDQMRNCQYYESSVHKPVDFITECTSTESRTVEHEPIPNPIPNIHYDKPNYPIPGESNRNPLKTDIATLGKKYVSIEDRRTD